MIGATQAAQKIAGRRWKTLVEGEFDGPLYPIHPSAEAVRGHPAYRTLREVPGPVDLAVIVVPSEAMANVTRDCVEVGVGAMVVISGGFGETGEEGKLREAQLLAQIQAEGIRMIGPNCAGIASMPANLNITGFEVPKGPVGLISQSGNIALNLSFLANRAGGGFSRQITIGNSADLGVVELTDFLLHDPDTEVVLIYLEGWRDGEGRRLIDVVQTAGVGKPVIILNPGSTETGRRAALSHTGALAAPQRIAAGAYRQSGILQVHDIEEAWVLAVGLSALPAMASPNVCILSDGGGHATLVCDAIDRAGLQVPQFSEATRQRLAELLPSRCAIDNPVDFAGVAEAEPDAIPPVLDACLADAEISGAVLVGHFGGYHRIGGEAVGPHENDTASALSEIVQRRAKPLLVHSVHGNDDLPTLNILRSAGVPVTASISTLAAVAGRLWQAGSARGRTFPKSDKPNLTQQVYERAAILERAAPGPPKWLMEPEARAWLRLSDIAVPDYRTAETADECAAAIEAFGVAVAMKRIAPNAVHKSEAGGVRLNVTGVDEARAIFGNMMAGDVGSTRILLTPMITDGIEIVIGSARDRQFGPFVMFGLGGVQIEALDDVAFRPAPISHGDAREMFAELRARKLLECSNGELLPGLNAAIDLLVQVSRLMAVRPEIGEIDLNPVIIHETGVDIADARIVLT